MNDNNDLESGFLPRIVRLTSWLEDYSDLYVQLVRNPVGIGFPDDESPDTKIHSVQEIIRVCDLNQALSEYAEWNLWRSWQVFSDRLCSNPVSYVPLFIDIDNEESDLGRAYNLTQDCLDWFESTNKYSAPDHLRVVFSGKKGFHIEARPSHPVNNRLVREDLLSGLKKMGLENRGSSNCFLDGTIDPVHDFVRLTGSFNSWKRSHGLIRRKVIQLSLEDFRRLRLENILERSEAG